MFDELSSRFEDAVKGLRGEAKISENNINDALKEVKRALLDADVSLSVVKEFISDVKEKAVGERWGKNKPMNINNSKDKTNQFNGLSRARQMLFETRNKRSVWTVKTKPYKESHFAVFPKELITPCILSGSEYGDIVLDPFIGSGTTAETAKNLGRKYIGVELNQEYKNIVDKRSDLFQYDLDLKYG